ncbi:MAG: cytochrome c oxidase assembly factor Coa1 family protein [Blastocatellia bacterium]
MILTIVGFIAAVAYLAFGSMKSSYAYEQAMAKTRSNAAVVRELGEPIEPGWFVSGRISVNESSGHADLSIPVSGPKKSGTVYVLAAKRLGKWDIHALEIEIEGKTERINLLTPSSE